MAHRLFTLGDFVALHRTVGRLCINCRCEKATAAMEKVDKKLEILGAKIKIDRWRSSMALPMDMERSH